jgi:hypothetical protein
VTEAARFPRGSHGKHETVRAMFALYVAMIAAGVGVALVVAVLG